jgi:GNAT superfamily N-acetyltransferase
MDINLKTLEKRDIPEITSAFKDSEWSVAPSHFEGFLAEQDRKERVVLLAYLDIDFAGFVTVRWQSVYPPFAEKAIPEISDLRVLRAFRRRGIATALVDEAERRIFERSPLAGIGVGLYADYGAAQCMYVLRGYVPDGWGIFYNSMPVNPGHDVFVDDNLVLHFIKERR